MRQPVDQDEASVGRFGGLIVYKACIDRAREGGLFDSLRCHEALKKSRETA